MSRKPFIIFLLTLCCWLSLAILPAAINLSSSSSPSTIGKNEEVVLTLEITSDARLRLDAPQLPEMPDFTFRNLSQSTSAGFSIINGNASSTYTYTFDYYLMPKKAGNLVIPAFTVPVANYRFTTQSFNIRVLDKPFAGRQPSGQTNPWGLGQGFSPFMPDPFNLDYGYDDQGDIRIVAQPDKQSVYLDEPLLVTYRLYTNQLVSSLEVKEEKDSGGYGKENYSEPTRLNYEDTVINNRPYKTAVLKTLAVSPNRTGEITLPQISANVLVGTMGLFSRSLTTAPVKITVKPLPESGRPVSYTGAVGHFTVTDNLSTQTVRLGEALEYQLVISGKGNFNQFSYPPYPEQADFRVATPSTDDQLQAGMLGKRTIRYLLIPKREGEYRLPGVEFNWFDPVSESWQTFRSRPYPVKVKPGNVITFISNVFQREFIRQLTPFSPSSTYRNFLILPESFYYWLAVILLLLTLLPVSYLGRQRRLKETDPELAAARGSDKVLKTYLQQASFAVQNASSDFYPAAETGLMRYLSDKYRISQRYSTAEKILLLRKKGLDETLIQSLEAFLKRCQEARFMPGGFDAQTLLADHQALKTLIRGFILSGKQRRTR